MFDKVSPEVQAVFLAFIIAFLRVVYDRKETAPLRIFLECLICGFLTFAVHHAIIALGLSVDWSIFAGGFIGFFGTYTVRAFSLKFINKKM